MKKVALVTGVGKPTGIGFEVCRQLGSKEFKVWLSARNDQAAAALASALQKEGLDVEPLELDVSQPTSVTRAVTQVGKLDGPDQ